MILTWIFIDINVKLLVKNKSLTCNFFLHFTDFLRKVYGILSVQLLFTFLTASVFKWSSVITYIVQTKLVIDRLYTDKL